MGSRNKWGFQTLCAFVKSNNCISYSNNVCKTTRSYLGLKYKHNIQQLWRKQSIFNSLELSLTERLAKNVPMSCFPGSIRWCLVANYPNPKSLLIFLPSRCFVIVNTVCGHSPLSSSSSSSLFPHLFLLLRLGLCCLHQANSHDPGIFFGFCL